MLPYLLSLQFHILMWMLGWQTILTNVDMSEPVLYMFQWRHAFLLKTFVTFSIITIRRFYYFIHIHILLTYTCVNLTLRTRKSNPIIFGSGLDIIYGYSCSQNYKYGNRKTSILFEWILRSWFLIAQNLDPNYGKKSFLGVFKNCHKFTNHVSKLQRRLLIGEKHIMKFKDLKLS